MISTPALWVAIAAMVPLMVLTALQDLKDLKISNYLVLAVIVTFLVTGFWGLPLETFGWRLLQGVVVLILGFIVFQFGVIGGGDAKMAAALAPFVVLQDITTVLLVYVVVTFAMLLVLRLIMHYRRHAPTGWKAIDQQTQPLAERVFPMGLVFGVTIVIYLGMHAADALT